MTLPELLEANEIMFVTMAALLGLVIGSFLNVVNHRLPIMLQREWRAQCYEYLQLDADNSDATDAEQTHTTFNLMTPGSHCPACNASIKPWHNIPVISYLVLRGRCAYCGTAIHWQYPVLELCTAILSAIVAWHFGLQWSCLAALVFTWSLISLTVIDIKHQLLPDHITLPLLWLGLVLSVTGFGTGVSAADAIIGAAAGYLLLWSVYWIFRLFTGREGMGYGDFKLLAALGAWLGWQQLISIVILSSLAGALVGIVLAIVAGRDKNIPMSFGPYLAAAGFIALIWGDNLNIWQLTPMVY
jgi:leader peptidase (prepilin peptidase) / N-methyltransferase